MKELRLETLDHTIEIRGVSDHELYDVLQWVRTLRLSIESSLAPFSLFEHRHLEDDVTTQLGRFELKAVG